MSIVILKLSNGQEIAGTEQEPRNDFIIITDPLLIDNRFDPMTNTRLMVLSRYNAFSNEMEVAIPLNHIVTRYPTNDSFVRYYHYSLQHMIQVRDKLIIEDLDRTASHIENILQPSDHPSDDSGFAPTDKDDEELLIDMAGMYLSGNTVH